MRLRGKIAFITGAANGIGKAIAMAFVQEGAVPCLNDIDEPGLHKLGEEIAGYGQKDFLLLHGDITKLSKITELFGKIGEKYGRLDVLVNNAGGSMNHSIHLLEISEAQWDQVLNINLKDTFFCSQEGIKLMLKNNGGCIVNVASLAGRRGGAHSRPHYSASKAAVLGLTRHMAREFGQFGIRINAVAPGHCISSERLEKMWEMRRQAGTAEKLISEVALKRVSTAEEQAKVVVFLASDEASYITGATIDVNGGFICI